MFDSTCHISLNISFLFDISVVTLMFTAYLLGDFFVDSHTDFVNFKLEKWILWLFKTQTINVICKSSYTHEQMIVF